MRKFSALILLFTAPIVIILISMELLLRNIPNDYSYKCNYLNKNSNAIEVLYLGNSHIYFGLNPECSKYKSFNAAHISQSLNYDLALLEKYNQNWKNLKCIVIPIDYFSMYSSLESGVEKWRIKNYKIYYDIYQDHYFWNQFELTNGKFNDNISRLKKNTFKNQSDLSCNTLGFGTTYNSKFNKNLIETGRESAQRHTLNINNNRWFSRNKKTINAIIKFSKQHNVKILFITCPAYKSYIQNLKQKQLNTTIATISQICLKNKNTYYHNLLMDKSFKEVDFYDADHLNEIGAQKLTQKIDSLLTSNTTQCLKNPSKK